MERCWKKWAPSNRKVRRRNSAAEPAAALAQIANRFRDVKSSVTATAAGAGPTNEAARRAIPAIAKDLLAHRGSSLVVAGEFQTAEVHALAHSINQALGNVGKTVDYTAPIEFQAADPVESLRQLVAQIESENEVVRGLLAEMIAPPAPLDFIPVEQADPVREADTDECAGSSEPLRAGREREFRASFQIVVDCDCESQQQALYERLATEGYRCRVLTLS